MAAAAVLIAFACALRPQTDVSYNATARQNSTRPPAADEATYTCSLCGHVYDPQKDGGGVPFEKLPDSWTCPVCGAPKSAYKSSIVDGRRVWTHDDTRPPAADEATYTCSLCGHVYDPQKDGGGVPFEKLPDSWTCPVCGAPKSAYKSSTVDGRRVWTHDDTH
jgi:rubredoxin